MAEFAITLVRRFEAARNDVFEAFRDAADWWCPAGYTMSSAEVDFREGGSYRIGMIGPSSDVPLVVHGTYVLIDYPSQLVFTHTFVEHPQWGDSGLSDHETLVTVDIEQNGPLAELRLLHERLPTERARDMMQGGFGTILDALAEYMASSKSAG